MKFDSSQSLSRLAEILDCDFVGDPDFLVEGLNEIHRAQKGDLIFVDHPKYYDTALDSVASAVLINKKVDDNKGKALLISDNVFHDFNRLIQTFKPEILSRSEHHPDSKIASSAYVAPGVITGPGVCIGENSVIMPNTVLYADVHIGSNVRIHANTTIGSDAFYYQNKEGQYKKFNSCGRVIIEDDVEIGAGCSIDRGVTHDTIIGEGTKIDNLVHIGHDTVIGKRCLLAGQVGVAGCVKIGNDSVMWGQVGIAANIEIGDNVTILAQSGISKNLESGYTYFGSPAEEARQKFREIAGLRQLLSRNS